MSKLNVKLCLEIGCVNKPLTFALCLNHRYLKKSRLLNFNVATLSSASSKGFLAATTYSTNQTNKADSMCH
jgi:hypothetical protein